MNRLTFAMAAAASVIGMAMSAMAYDSAMRGQEQRENYSERQGMRGQQTSGMYGDSTPCMQVGWMDNDEIQKWRAKHPGRELCYSDQVGDSQPMYRGSERQQRERQTSMQRN